MIVTANTPLEKEMITSLQKLMSGSSNPTIPKNSLIQPLLYTEIMMENILR